MHNETGNNIGGGSDTSVLEAEVRSAVEQGHNVQEVVRQLIHRHDRARQPQLAGAALLWSARLSRRGVRRRVAVAVDLEKQQGGSGMSA